MLFDSSLLVIRAIASKEVQGLHVFDAEDVLLEYCTSVTLSGSRWMVSKTDKKKKRCRLFNSLHSSSLSRPGAYITHNAAQPPTVRSEILMCYVALSH